MSQLGHVLPLAALAAVMSYGAPLLAQTIIDEWQGVKAAPPPEHSIVYKVTPTSIDMVKFAN
jgi:hypothetical protein